ncbi:tetratricopeptide repeat protein, partial [Pararhodospirillum oryzae]|uniref:tetratricopeptide repeat protein n=1 Tax=Pararhodospirillum oryzae TaxID=478448 RepID=UPI0011BE4CA1
MNIDYSKINSRFNDLLKTYEYAINKFDNTGDIRSKATILGKISDTLQAIGEFDEAIHILCKEQIPIYKKLGDIRETAITMGKIADILMARGQLDDALRTHREEALPVFQRLGDVRETAVT